MIWWSLLPEDHWGIFSLDWSNHMWTIECSLKVLAENNKERNKIVMRSRSEQHPAGAIVFNDSESKISNWEKKVQKSILFLWVFNVWFKPNWLIKDNSKIMIVNTMLGQDKSCWLQVLEVWSGEDTETYWALVGRPAPLLVSHFAQRRPSEGGG